MAEGAYYLNSERISYRINYDCQRFHETKKKACEIVKIEIVC